MILGGLGPRVRYRITPGNFVNVFFFLQVIGKVVIVSYLNNIRIAMNLNYYNCFLSINRAVTRKKKQFILTN